MEHEEARRLAEEFLAAWNSQDVERVLACYTEDLVYRDPNTRGPIAGRAAFARYLAKLFRSWKMRWALREYFPFATEEGGAFLWKATIAPAEGGPAREFEGMDLAVLRGRKLARNEVYFDRMALVA